MSEWISVKDRLPEFIDGFSSSYVIVCTRFNEVREGYLIKERFNSISGNGFCDGRIAEITHWVPLPNPPEAA